jgi:multiple sugar transport system ATP-binding protein
MPEIVLKNVTKTFGSVCAVDDLDLVIPDGSFFTLLGPSGCGKTTTLRMIAGLEKPTGGVITIGGKTVFDSSSWTIVPPGKRNVGLVFQSYALWPHMTVWDNIAFPLTVKKLPMEERKAKVDAVMQQVQITGLGKRYPHELSGGQQQRVALARELVTGADLLLMDEPLSNLDAQLRLEMRAELKKLHRNTGQTIVYVTHDQLEAMTMSTHIAIMKDGLLHQVASPDDIYCKPANTFVAEFIGGLPINLIEASASGGIIENEQLHMRLELPDIHKTVKGKVTLGMRPEELRIANAPSKTTVKGTVDSVLPAGSEVLIRVRIGEYGLNIKERRGISIDMGEEAYVDFNLGEAVFFDADSGVNLLAG